MLKSRATVDVPRSRCDAHVFMDSMWPPTSLHMAVNAVHGMAATRRDTYEVVP